MEEYTKAAKKEGISVEEYLKKLVRKNNIKFDGKNWLAKNKSGNEIRWLAQNKISNYNYSREIKKAIDAGNELRRKNVNWNNANGKQQKILSKSFEAETAQELYKRVDITDFNNKVYNNSLKNDAGDFDAASSQIIIECKYSFSKNAILGKFLKQFEKYIDPFNPNYINFENKKVVLVIRKFRGTDINHKVLKSLQEKGVIIITDIRQIKNI